MKNFERLLELVEKLPCGAMSIERNEHLTIYEDLEEWLEDKAEVSEEIIQKCKAANEAWRIQIYTHTPVGFYLVYDSNLEDACGKLIETLEEIVKKKGENNGKI